MPGNSVKNCVHFCLQPLVPFGRCDQLSASLHDEQNRKVVHASCTWYWVLVFGSSKGNGDVPWSLSSMTYKNISLGPFKERMLSKPAKHIIKWRSNFPHYFYSKLLFKSFKQRFSWKWIYQIVQTFPLVLWRGKGSCWNVAEFLQLFASTRKENNFNFCRQMVFFGALGIWKRINGRIEVSFKWLWYWFFFDNKRG